MTEEELPTVLLVDDEERILRSMRRTLRSESCRLVCAPGGAAALTWAEGMEPDLVVTDLGMPALSGVELLRRVRRLHPDTVFVVLTGHGEMDGELQGLGDAGVYRILAKPWDDEELRITVRLALRYRELLQESRRLRARVDERIELARAREEEGG